MQFVIFKMLISIFVILFIDKKLFDKCNIHIIINNINCDDNHK